MEVVDSGHPEQDRALSLREGAILQGFPLSYEFAPSNGLINRTVIGRLIGNAVPVELGKLIGLSFFQTFAKGNDQWRITTTR